jgi:hypothetical protein
MVLVSRCLPECLVETEVEVRYETSLVKIHNIKFMFEKNIVQRFTLKIGSEAI